MVISSSTARTSVWARGSTCSSLPSTVGLSRSALNCESSGSSSTNSVVYDDDGVVSCTSPCTVMFHVPAGNGAADRAGRQGDLGHPDRRCRPPRSARRGGAPRGRRPGRGSGRRPARTRSRSSTATARGGRCRGCRRAAARGGRTCCGSAGPGRSSGCRGRGRCRCSRRAGRRSPEPPRPLALRPSPSARKVVGKWGTRPGSTMATPSAPTPTTRPSVAKAVVGSASGPLRGVWRGGSPGAQGAHALAPDEGEPRERGRHGVPGAQPVTGVGRRREERRQQRDAGQRRAAVRHPDRVDRHRREADEQADREDRAAVGRGRGGVVGDGGLGLLEQHPEGAAGLGGREQVVPEVAAAVQQRGRVHEHRELAHHDEGPVRGDAAQPHPGEGDDGDEQHAGPEPRRRGEQGGQRQGDRDAWRGRRAGPRRAGPGSPGPHDLATDDGRPGQRRRRAGVDRGRHPAGGLQDGQGGVGVPGRRRHRGGCARRTTRGRPPWRRRPSRAGAGPARVRASSSPTGPPT